MSQGSYVLSVHIGSLATLAFDMYVLLVGQHLCFCLYVHTVEFTVYTVGLLNSTLNSFQTISH